MNIYLQLLLTAFITIFVIDLSGFTSTILTIASGIKRKTVDQLRPFTCSLCMVWWVGLIYLLISRSASLETIAFVAMLSALSNPISQLLIFIREALVKLVAILANTFNL